MTLRGLKEYAQVEGVSIKLGVALELAEDLSHGNRAPEMAENCEKVSHSSARSHINVVPEGNGTCMCMTRADN